MNPPAWGLLRSSGYGTANYGIHFHYFHPNLTAAAGNDGSGDGFFEYGTGEMDGGGVGMHREDRPPNSSGLRQLIVVAGMLS